ncbi:hypothetical protein AAAC51_41620 [Priestia megaterium]
MIREELIKANLMSEDQTKIINKDLEEEDINENSFKEALLLLAKKIEEMDKKWKRKNN